MTEERKKHMHSCSPETLEMVYDFIVERIKIQGYGPTMREIEAGVGKSLGTVAVAVKRLDTDGRIRRSLDRRAVIMLPHGVTA